MATGLGPRVELSMEDMKVAVLRVMKRRSRPHMETSAYEMVAGLYRDGIWCTQKEAHDAMVELEVAGKLRKSQHGYQLVAKVA